MFAHATDTELLFGVHNKNEHAFTALYNKYYQTLCTKAFAKISSEFIVEEIVQDVFVELWHKAALLDVAGNVEAWLYATMRNKILHEYRKERTRQYYLKAIQQWDKEVTATPEALVSKKQVEEVLATAIQQLPTQCRQAFVLSRFENMSYKEIAEQMGISIKTVEKHIGKALHDLREVLHDLHVVDPHLWMPVALLLAGVS